MAFASALRPSYESCKKTEYISLRVRGCRQTPCCPGREGVPPDAVLSQRRGRARMRRAAAVMLAVGVRSAAPSFACHVGPGRTGGRRCGPHQGAPHRKAETENREVPPLGARCPCYRAVQK
mmetsp:Transcript_10156/g.20402  ORF Transcript_10156/g.20402 Transcript_10156/m.20402 type:complete len:121 (-) Transcript_10156:34-396(-)